MNSISFRVPESELQLIKQYTAANNLSLSAFIRAAVLDRIEEDLCLDEERILRAKERLNTEKVSDHEEVWKRLGV